MTYGTDRHDLRCTNRFPSRLRLTASGIVLTAALWGGAVVAQPAKPPVTFTDGQKVEIREGDSWSAGAVVKREGRKYLVHYEGGDAAQDEWVLPDRLRLPGAPVATTPGVKPGTGAPATPATAPAKPQFAQWKVDDKVEVKWGGTWYTASVMNKRGNWYLVIYESNFKGWKEWVEPWRIRKRGSTEDTIGIAHTNPSMFPNAKVIEPPNHEPAPTPVTEAAGRSPREEKEKADQATAAKAAPITPADFTALKDVAVGGGDVGALSPDPTPKPAQPVPPQPVVIAGLTGDFAERVQSVTFGGPLAPTAVVVGGEFGSDKTGVTKVQKITLAGGHFAGTVTIPVTVKVSDLSADGKQLLAHSTAFGFGVSDRLDVWNIDAAEAKQVISFKPYDDQTGSARDVVWAKFLAPDHVATLNSDGRLIVFDLKGKAIWTAKVNGSVTPALSGGGKYLAVVAGEIAAVLDPSTGTTLKTLNGATGSGSLSFKTDGTQLAATAPDTLLVWDLKTGELAHELSPLGALGQQIDWVAEGFVLLDGTYLVSLPQKLVVWQYTTGVKRTHREQATSGQFAGRFWYVASPSRGGVGASKPVLASVLIPNEKVKAGAAKLKSDEQLVVKPGERVNLEVNLPDDIREKVMAALKLQLTANGLVVQDGAPLRLVVGTDQGEAKEMHYGNMMGPRFGPMAQDTQVSVNSLISKISFIGPDGNTLWERKSVTMPPPILHLKKDQSIQDAINEAMVPRATFFVGVKIPKFVPKPADPGSIGTSRLTAQGTVLD